jgi:hypothetical protein
MRLASTTTLLTLSLSKDDPQEAPRPVGGLTLRQAQDGAYWVSNRCAAAIEGHSA